MVSSLNETALSTIGNNCERPYPVSAMLTNALLPQVLISIFLASKLLSLKGDVLISSKKLIDLDNLFKLAKILLSNSSVLST